MAVLGAIAVGTVIGVVVLVAAFEVCNEFELNLFHIGDAA